MGPEKTQYKCHVIVIPYPSQGHINPLLQFAKRLSSKGIKATFATTPYTLSSISDPSISLESISDGFDLGGFSQARNPDLYLKSFKTHGSKTLSQLIEKYNSSSTPIDCVIYDSFFPWALDVAKQHGLFGALFFTNSVAVCADFCRIRLGVLGLPVRREESPLVVPGLPPPLSFGDVPTFLRAPDCYPAYLAMTLSPFSNLDGADCIFCNSFEELEGEGKKGTPQLWSATLIGPMVPSAHLDGRIKGDNGHRASQWKPLSKECTNWLKMKADKSIVYVSLGSMVSLIDEQMEEIAWGLKGSNLDFIWLVRNSEVNKLPSEFVDSTTEKGLIVTRCYQLDMLAHQTIGCFVTHCGWKSTLEGLRFGVPMVGVPKWRDQLTNAKFMDEIWKVGVTAKEDENGIVRREELMSCLEQVMEGERSVEIRKNASKWKRLAKEAISEGGSSDKCIDEFVEQLKSSRNNNG